MEEWREQSLLTAKIVALKHGQGISDSKGDRVGVGGKIRSLSEVTRPRCVSDVWEGPCVEAGPHCRPASGVSQVPANSTTGGSALKLYVRQMARLRRGPPYAAWRLLKFPRSLAQTTSWRPWRKTTCSRSNWARCSLTLGRDAPTRLARSL